MVVGRTSSPFRIKKEAFSPPWKFTAVSSWPIFIIISFFLFFFTVFLPWTEVFVPFRVPLRNTSGPQKDPLLLVLRWKCLGRGIASRGGRNINKDGRNFLGARMQDTDGYGWSEPLTIDVDNWHPRFDRPLWYYMAATKGWPYFLGARFLSRIRFNILPFDGNFFSFSFFFLPITILADIYKYLDAVRFVHIWLFITMRKFQTEENLLNVQVDRIYK